MPGQPRSTGPDPFPSVEPGRVNDLWYEEEPIDAGPPKAYQDVTSLPSTGAVLRTVARSRPVRRWLTAVLAALAAGAVAYLVTRPGPPTRDDVLDAIVAAAERAGQPIGPDVADCVVTELESEKVDYDEILSTKPPSVELRRAFDNAYLRCAG